MPISLSTYYDHLLEWELVHDLMEQFEEKEKELALQEVLTAVDHAVNQAILEQLDKAHHEEYLNMCQIRYHEPTILTWVQERTVHDNISGLIQETYITVYAQLKVELQCSTEYDHN